MISERIVVKVVGFISGITWLLRLNARLENAARRFRPVRVLLATLAEVTRNDAQQLVAGIAYYGMVALVPVSVAILQVLALMLGEEQGREWFSSFSSAVLPPSIDLGGLLVTQDATATGITALFALLGLAWGSFKLFGAVGVVVNRMWGIEPRHVGIVSKMRQYLLMSATALVLLMSSVITYLMSQDLASLALRELELEGWADTLATAIASGWSNVIAGLLLVAAFLIVYRYVPERRVRWRWALSGAVLAGMALQLVNYGVSLFLAYLAPSHLLYGPLASVLIILVWLFASSATLAGGAAVAAYGQSVYEGDGPTPGPGWFLR